MRKQGSMTQGVEILIFLDSPFLHVFEAKFTDLDVSNLRLCSKLLNNSFWTTIT